MEQVLLVRYGEIHLKGLNRPFFERKLISVFDKITEAKDSVERSANIRLTLIDLLASV